MKATFNRQALTDALGLLTAVVPSRTPKPILRCVHITAGKEGVYLAATDLEVGINYSLSEVTVDEPGEIIIPADKLAAVVRESADEVLSFRAEEGSCEIIGSDSHFTIYGQKAGQYPTVPSFDGEPHLEVAMGDLHKGIEQCLFAAARESTRYAINGILWEIKGKQLFLVATDGRRLARSKIRLGATPAEQIAKAKLIVPAKTMGLLEKLGGSDSEIVGVRLVDNQVLINCANVAISSTIVEGNFPKYEDIIPTDYEKRVKLSAEVMLSAVRRAALLTSEESRGIRLSLSQGSLNFNGRAPETGDAQVTMPVEYKGEPMEIGFNPQFLIDVLRIVKTGEIELELGEADRPGLIKSGKDFIYVLMPINLG